MIPPTVFFQKFWTFGPKFSPFSLHFPPPNSFFRNSPQTHALFLLTLIFETKFPGDLMTTQKVPLKIFSVL